MPITPKGTLHGFELIQFASFYPGAYEEHFILPEQSKDLQFAVWGLGFGV